jgi:hypothetical protein
VKFRRDFANAGSSSTFAVDNSPYYVYVLRHERSRAGCRGFSPTVVLDWNASNGDRRIVFCCLRKADRQLRICLRLHRLYLWSTRGVRGWVGSFADISDVYGWCDGVGRQFPDDFRGFDFAIYCYPYALPAFLSPCGWPVETRASLQDSC